MRLKYPAILLSLLFVLAACAPTQVTPTPVPPTATPVPELSATREAPTQIPNTPVPATNTAAPVTNTAMPAATAQPTQAASTPTGTAAATKPASTPAVRPSSTSSGPLTATIYVANCRSTPTTDKPGQITIQISIEASGGNGVYHYVYQDKEMPGKFIDVLGERGTRVVGFVTLNSGDGQTLKKTFDISAADLNCP